MDPIAIVIVAAGWVLLGLVVGLWMVRHGHDPRWVAIAVALGPIFVPIALERVERLPRLAASSLGGLSERHDDSASRPRVLIGLDGSPESKQALTRTIDLLGARCELLMLAEVVWYEAGEDDTRPELAAATERLAAAATAAEEAGVEVRFEVLAGPPGEALRRFAEEQNMDLVVVGRRGRGLSPHLLGSVSSDLVRHAHLPVLVVEPVPSTSISRPLTETSARARG
ncbi:universal stress protein [Nocardioides sp. NPDC006273]|uniref:universal stress protein n=1 Tax=Nocardioides sp. NPDC006273 TaxID=3155598 RepID=UPI0033B2B836